MPDPETLDTRRRKRIVEFIIAGFNNASEAIRFGNTVEQLVNEKVYDKFDLKMQQQIATPNSKIAITRQWLGPTTLKLIFLDVPHQTAAWFIVEQTRKTVSTHNEVHEASAEITHELVREKPQPQSLTLTFIPRTSRVNSIGG
jgi:hypothetical protein